MLDHVTIGVSDLERSKAFSDKALRAIGIERLYSEGAEFFGYGAHKKAFFWIGLKPSAITGVHVAFAVPARIAGAQILCKQRNNLGIFLFVPEKFSIRPIIAGEINSLNRIP